LAVRLSFSPASRIGRRRGGEPASGLTVGPAGGHQRPGKDALDLWKVVLGVQWQGEVATASRAAVVKPVGQVTTAPMQSKKVFEASPDQNFNSA